MSINRGKYLKGQRYRAHRRAARMSAGAILVRVGIPKGVKLKPGEDWIRHFVIADNLSDYMARSDRRLSWREKKKKSRVISRREDNLLCREATMNGGE